MDSQNRNDKDPNQGSEPDWGFAEYAYLVSQAGIPIGILANRVVLRYGSPQGMAASSALVGLWVAAVVGLRILANRKKKR